MERNEDYTATAVAVQPQQLQPPIVQHPQQSYVEHIIFSCFVFSFCNCCFGIAAFVYAC